MSNLPWKARILFYIASIILRACLRKDFTVNRRLLSFLEFKASPSKDSRGGVISSDVIVDNSRRLWFRIYTPTNSAPETSSFPVIIFAHGGGFCLCAVDSLGYDSHCKKLTDELRAIIVSINYRLAPEHKYPCQYEDCFDALKYVDANLHHLSPSADLGRCFLLGDSAGGNLIHHMAVKASEYAFKRLKIVGLMSIQPFFGGEERTESENRLARAPMLTLEHTDWYWKAFLPQGTDRDHRVVNVFGPNSHDISGVKYPSTLVCIGGIDLLQDWQRKYYQGLKEIGTKVQLVEYPNAVHGFWMLSMFPETSLLIKELKSFIEKACISQ
ncbi:hypothetical protein K2173_007079 [Erythroxylum novogranatense]|uniref:Alpha/beta hydrolase fold-3 domain-containing protein n=1 Tax=Erythroxylum novogranatense TaxID=1862640 RepID=A0AAV8SYI5_9ROSI|nr:hypothetical protein K2173_007079 [Erythroxylum novogranatense]